MRVPLFLSAAMLTAAMGLASGEGETVEAEGIVIEEARAQSAGPSARSAAGYLTITNTTGVEDRLLAAESPAAQRVEIHTHELVDGIARMAEIAEGVPVMPGASVAFEPGGLHLMFMGLQEPWGAEGGVVVTLTFERAGAIPVTFSVDRVGHTHDPLAHEGEAEAEGADD